MDVYVSEKFKTYDGGFSELEEDVESFSEINSVTDWSTVRSLDDHASEKFKIPDGSSSEVGRDVESSFKINFVTDWSMVSP